VPLNYFIRVCGMAPKALKYLRFLCNLCAVFSNDNFGIILSVTCQERFLSAIITQLLRLQINLFYPGG